MEEKDFLDLKNKNIYIRKVLVEKYSKEYMINWIKKQKNIELSYIAYINNTYGSAICYQV